VTAKREARIKNIFITCTHTVVTAEYRHTTLVVYFEERGPFYLGHIPGEPDALASERQDAEGPLQDIADAGSDNGVAGPINRYQY
jgi:hypothetical protein